MVRSAAERAFLPTRSLLEEIGDMMILTGRTILSALRPPYPYGGEFVSQFLFALRLCWFLLLISTVCICYAAPGRQEANFLAIFCARERVGGGRGGVGGGRGGGRPRPGRGGGGGRAPPPPPRLGCPQGARGARR